ncbi:hypothetical protein EXIGLDRAFT_831762 [Exidia glandulosa HHB12029]|uniref:Uncharacterized protein n=1 Tax=Exidia glandulosa HHB12029 TaxID=1314781 RepID=A0A165MA69_EXIGL|nr:hypothetical protein EXIGLDRAFT_831762 [Exidia glandulosa HHB12029]
MFFSTLIISAVLAVPAIASPAFKLSEKRQACSAVSCGTTSDATLSDCQALVDPATWSAAFAGGSNVCHFTNGLNFNAPAYNVACHGNCCAYYAPGFRTTANFDENSLRDRAASLLGCGDTDKNSINGLTVATIDGSGVCLSNGDGCGDCFDDSDFFGTC